MPSLDRQYSLGQQSSLASGPPSALPSDDEEENIHGYAASQQHKRKKKSLPGRVKNAFSHMHLPILSRTPSLSRVPSLDSRHDSKDSSHNATPQHVPAGHNVPSHPATTSLIPQHHQPFTLQQHQHLLQQIQPYFTGRGRNAGSSQQQHRRDSDDPLFIAVGGHNGSGEGPDSRRPSYASNHTISSTGSKLSHNMPGAGSEDADDEADLSGSGTFSPQDYFTPFYSGFPPRGQNFQSIGDGGFNLSNQTLGTNGDEASMPLNFVNSRPNPLHFPDPEQMHDHDATSSQGETYGREYRSTPASRSGSVASQVSTYSEAVSPHSNVPPTPTTPSRTKKSKKSIFNRLRTKAQNNSAIASVTGGQSSGQDVSSDHDSLHSIRPRTSSPNLQSLKSGDPFYSKEDALGPSMNSAAPTMHRAGTKQGLSDEQAKELNRVRRTTSQSSLGRSGLDRSKSAHVSPPNLSQPLGRALSRKGTIIDQPGASFSRKSPVRQMSYQEPGTTGAADKVNPFMLKLNPNIGEKDLEGIRKEGSPAPLPPTAEGDAKWRAPESWQVPSDEMHMSEDALWAPAIASKLEKEGNQLYHVRIFKEDKSFSTLSCPLNSTATDVLSAMARKMYRDNFVGYDLTVKTGDLSRILQKHERPLVLQRILLEFIGYTEKDNFPSLGREDLSYLCRFEFTKSPLKSLTQDSEVEMPIRDFRTVFLRNRCLQTIPIVYFQNAEEVEFLDVSENPSIIVPLDFIQSCINLRAIRFINNHCLQFPHNLNKASTLISLDLSNNLLVSLDNVDMSELGRLRSFNLQGNRLDSLPDEIGKLKSLCLLNLSSNNINKVNEALFKLTSLVSLDLSFNHICELPSDIGKLVNIERLAISNNSLAKFPDEFCELKQLSELDVRYNSLHNISILANLPNLTALFCSKNSVYSCNVQFQRLVQLHLDRNPITHISFNEPLASLAVLDLGKAKLTDLSESFIDQVPMLERLVLEGNHLNQLPYNIGTLRRLLYLNLSKNQLTALPEGIDQLQELRTLDLHSNNLKALPAEIWNLPSLLELNVSSNLLTTFPKSKAQGSSVGSVDMAQRLNSASRQGSTTPAPLATPLFSAFNGAFDFNGDKLTGDARRPSVRSESSSMPSPLEATSRRGSGAIVAPPHAMCAASADVTSFSTEPESFFLGNDLKKPCPPLALCLTTLRAADNRLTDDCLWEIGGLFQLQHLNLSYNELMDIPSGTLARLQRLRELYLSGNNLANLLQDDLEKLQSLRVLHANLNKLHSLPPELGKIAHLQVFDVGSNSLRYNINNWPYDWNWHYNPELKYLNFSGNRRLEVKTQHVPGLFGRNPSDHTNLSDFTVLSNLRSLGLMDVTLMTPMVPDQNENRRVRTYGSYVLGMGYGMADTLGKNDNLSSMDLVVEKFRGSEKEAIIGLFDGRMPANRSTGTISAAGVLEQTGNKISALMQESFASTFASELDMLESKGGDVPDALRRAFLSTNRNIGNTTLLEPEESTRPKHLNHASDVVRRLREQDRKTGTCATVVYIQNTKMYVANIGDSMAVLSRGNGDYKVVTERHIPTNPDELARIRSGAGLISSDGLLDDVLDVSRIIGCYNLVPHIFAAPYVSEHDLTDADDFLIIASKQLWEYMSFEDAVDLARTEVSDPMTAAQKLRDFAIAYGCTENIMVMVVGVGGFRRQSTTRPNRGMNNYGGSAMMGSGEEDMLLTSSLFKKRRDKSLLPEDSSLARLGGEIDPPVGEVVLVFTDIKNSTLLWETYPIATRSAIKLHNAIMRRNIRIMGGYEVKTEGDAFIVSFSTATSALLWCFNVQTQLLDADWPSEILEFDSNFITDDKGKVIFRGLSVRMGLNYGVPVFETDVITKRMDYYGPMVNRTARISAVADGGQIAISSDFLSEFKKLEAAHESVLSHRKSIAEAYGDEVTGSVLDRDMKILKVTGYQIQELGEMKLKGLENPELVSVIYPQQLLGRQEYHKENPTQEQLSQQVSQYVLQQQLQKPARRPQHPIGAGAPRIGGLTLDNLSQLRMISNRLENVCSMLNLGGMEQTGFRDYNYKTSNAVNLVIPPTDYDYSIFFDQLITRVENALSTLYIRALGATLFADDDKPAELADASQIISLLIKSLKELKAGSVEGNAAKLSVLTEATSEAAETSQRQSRIMKDESTNHDKNTSGIASTSNDDTVSAQTLFSQN